MPKSFNLQCCLQNVVWCKVLSFIFDKVDGCIRKYDGTKYSNSNILIQF